MDAKIIPGPRKDNRGFQVLALYSQPKTVPYNCSHKHWQVQSLQWKESQELLGITHKS